MAQKTKSPLASSAIWSGGIGALVFGLRLFKGWNLDADEARGILDNLIALKGSAIGFAASAGVIAARWKAWNFDKSVLKSRTFWCAMGKAAAIVLTASGLGDSANVEQQFGALFDSLTLAAGTATAIGAVAGRLKAERKIEIKKPEVVG